MGYQSGHGCNCKNTYNFVVLLRKVVRCKYHTDLLRMQSSWLYIDKHKFLKMHNNSILKQTLFITY